MNGFFIIAEISELQQFLKVEEAAVSEMLKNCRRCINNSIRSKMMINGNFLLFPVEAELEEAAAIVEASENLLAALSGYQDDIHEFSMILVYRLKTEPEKFLNEFKPNFFSDSVDSALLIENRIMRAAGRSADDDSYGIYQILAAEQQSVADDGHKHLKELIEPKEVGKLVKLIVPEIEAETSERNFVLSGESEFVIGLNLYAAINDAAGKNKNVAVINVDFLENETDIIKPFARSVDRRMLPVIEDYLKGVELRAWLESRDKLNEINSDYPEEYFFSIYCLYIKGVMLSLKDSMLPGIIIFSGDYSKNEESIRYAERVIEYLQDECRPTIFFINGSVECSLKTVEVKCCERDTPPDGADKLSFQHRRLLYAIRLCEGLFERHLADEFLIKLGYSQAEIHSGVQQLEREGCLVSGRFVRIMQSAKLEQLFEGISDKKEIAAVLAGFIIENFYNPAFADYGRAAVKLADFTDIDDAAEAVYKCLVMMLNFGRTVFVLNYLAENELLDRDLSDALELRSFLIENDKKSCRKILSGRSERAESPDNINNAMLLLEIGRYYHSMQDYQRALDYIKKVLIFLQEGDYPQYEGIAFIELGFVMMCKGKLLESSEYFTLAEEKLTGSGDDYSLIKACIFSAMQKYLWGSIDESLSEAETALQLVSESGFEEWYFFVEFFKCRLYFELGRYYDAEKILSGCLLRSELYRDERRRKIFSAWTARACIYQGKIYRGINMLLSLEEDPEVLFFLSEAYYFNGNMEKAVESIERAESSDEYFNLGFMPLEYISWKNGFESVEGRVLRSDKGTGVLLHNIRALHAFLLGMTGNREYGTEILFSLTRDEKISEDDPFNRLYFYFYCRLLERRQNTEMIDKLTLISKALKYLQQTSSRINTPKVRQQFMSKNYWNSKLVAEAQREKLL